MPVASVRGSAKKVNSPDFDETAKIFEPYLAPHDLSKTKIAYQQNIIEGESFDKK